MSPRLRIVLLACALAVAACDAPDAQLDPHDLKLAAQNLAALAAEAQLLAGQVAAHDVTSQFASVHGQALGQESLKLSEQLAKAAPAALRSPHDALALLNARFQAGASRIAQASAHQDELAQLQGEFGDIAARAKALDRQA